MLVSARCIAGSWIDSAFGIGMNNCFTVRMFGLIFITLPYFLQQLEHVMQKLVSLCVGLRV